MAFDDLSDNEAGEESKTDHNNNKFGHKKYESKNKVDEEKMQNKRLQKEANKTKKLNSQKGINTLTEEEHKAKKNKERLDKKSQKNDPKNKFKGKGGKGKQ